MDTRQPAEEEAWLSKSAANGNAQMANPRFPRSRWERRTKLEKMLLILLLVVVILLVVLLVVLLVLVVETSKEETSEPTAIVTSVYENKEVCMTKECVAAAAHIESSLDHSARPCEDFYQFACGGWLKGNVIPEDKSSLSTFGVLRDQVYIVLKNLLETPDAGELGSMTKAKDLYASCMDQERIAARGDTPLKDFMLSTYGGWPLTTVGWDESQFDIVDTLVRMNQHSSYSILYFFTGTDNKNSTKRVLKIDQCSFGMPGQKYYLVPRNDSLLQAYQDLIYSAASLMGLAEPETALQDVKDLVDFEIRLANISVPDEDRRDSNYLYNPMTLAQVHGNYSQELDWKRYVLSVTSLPDIGLTDVTDDEIIVNQSPLFFQRLTHVLRTTPKKTVANYMLWRQVFQLLGTQAEHYRELLKIYKKALFGTTSESPRFRRCAGYTVHYLGLAVGRMFIKDNFDATARNIALEMISGLQDAFDQLIDDLDWMDPSTKVVAKEKNRFIEAKIGYPEEILNDTYLETYYSNFTYNRLNYFENVLENKRETYSLAMRRLREAIDKNKWESPPSTVNAFYNSVKNQILFPAGILQPPFFSRTYPRSLNYGGIGVVIGHEITHGFDDRGRQYDKHGNLAHWWSQQVINKFKAKAQCIVDQYSNFTVEEVGLNLNGINTQGENIADNGGLKQAYKAYRNWVSAQGKEEPLLPGLNYTHDQLFFINFAQLWCVLMREGDALSRIRVGVHSPGRFRVIGSAQNSPEFSAAFNCSATSFMNKKDKCSVW